MAEEPSFRHRRVPIALGSATILVGLLTIRAWETGAVGSRDLLLVGVGIALGLAVVLLERQEIALLLAVGGQLRGSAVLQLVLVFAVLTAATVTATAVGRTFDLVAFAGLATVTVGELALLAAET